MRSETNIDQITFVHPHSPLVILRTRPYRTGSIYCSTPPNSVEGLCMSLAVFGTIAFDLIIHGLFSLPIVLKPMLDLFVVSFGFWFHPLFSLHFTFSADGRSLGLIKVFFSESSAAAVKDLIAFIRFNFIDIVPAHFHLRAFDPLFLDNFKGFDSNNFKFTGFF